MPNVYFAGLFAVLVLLGIGGAYVKGRSDGVAITTATYAARDLKAATDYAAKEREITEAYRAKETQWQKQIASVSTDYQGRLKKNEAALNIALSSGRLYDRFATANQANRDCTAPIASSTSGRDGKEGAYISEAAGIFLRRLASECDAVTIQLGAAQELLEKERE